MCTESANNELLEAIRESEGFDTVMDMLEHYATDSIVPGICKKCLAIESNCEPDAENNYCSECKSNQVKSIMILAGII